MTLGAQPHETVWNDYIRADYATWEVGQDCEVHYHEGAVEIFIRFDADETALMKILGLHPSLFTAT